MNLLKRIGRYAFILGFVYQCVAFGLMGYAYYETEEMRHAIAASFHIQAATIMIMIGVKS